MMRIDAHQHFWIYNPVRDTWIDESMSALKKDFLPGDLLPDLKKHNMEGTIAVQADPSEEETRFLLELASRNEFIKGVVGWVDLMGENIEDQLTDLKKYDKLCGFRHIVQSESDPRFIVREDFINGLRILKDLDFTYDILIYPKQLPATLELVQHLPDQKFVLDHIAKPLIKAGILDPWSRQIKELGKSKNVYCKISGIITEADHQRWNADEIKPYLDVVFEAFDTDRLMFGSDWPVCLLAGTYDQVVKLVENYTSSLHEDEKVKIFGGNACRFYGINTKG